MAEYSPDIQCITFVCGPTWTNSIEVVRALWLNVTQIYSLLSVHCWTPLVDVRCPAYTVLISLLSLVAVWPANNSQIRSIFLLCGPILYKKLCQLIGHCHQQQDRCLHLPNDWTMHLTITWSFFFQDWSVTLTAAHSTDSYNCTGEVIGHGVHPIWSNTL